MNKILTTLFIFILFFSFSQNDSTVKSSIYFRIMPVSICTGGGSLNNNINLPPSFAQTIEFGKSYGVIDLGLSLGSYTAYRRDTTTFAEFKITMDASQYGIFSNEFNLGIGYIFNSTTPIILEASYTIMAQIHHRFGVGLSTGFYDFVGREYDVTRAYYGLFIRYGLPRDMNGSLIKSKRKFKRHL